MTEEKTIKLTPEQILEREVSIENMKMNLEFSELNVKHFKTMIDMGLPIKQTQILLNQELAKIAQAKHNIIALTEQVESGELK